MMDQSASASRRRRYWLVALGIVAYHFIGFGIAWVTPADYLFQVLSAIVVCIAVSVVVAYTPVVWLVLRDGAQQSGDLLAIGIWMSWSAIIMQRAYALTWHWLGKPQWLLDTDIRSYYVLVMIGAGVLHIVAPRMINNRVPTPEWMKVGLICGFGVAIAFLLALLG